MDRSADQEESTRPLALVHLNINKRCRTRPVERCDIGWILMVAALCLVSFSSCCHAFSMSMEYKPPVKSSVSKFYDRRLSSSKASGSSSGGSSSETHKGHTSSSKAAVAGAAYAQQSPASFEQRMRDALFRGMNGVRRSEQRNVATASPATPPNLVTVESLQDYKRVVSDETVHLVAVRFHATYCRACKAVTPAFHKLAWTHPDIVFVDVPVTEKNAVLHQGLGVPSLPFAHIYHPSAGLVEETKLLRQNVASFRGKLEHYLQGSCPIVDEEEVCEEDDRWA